MAVSSAKLVGALRQLCFLGLPGRSLLPEAIGLLRQLVGFDVWGCFFIDDGASLTDAIVPDVPMAVIRDYVENFYNRPDGDGVTGMTTFSAMRSGQRVVLSSNFTSLSSLEKTEFWQRIMRPAQMAWTLQFPLRDGSRPLCTLVLSRPYGAKDFPPTALRQLNDVYDWMCHALARQDTDPAILSEATVATGGLGILVANQNGQIEFASPGAAGLLHQAANAPHSGTGLRHALAGDLGTLLRKLTSSAGCALNAGPDRPMLPAGTIRNRNGTFRLRAYALNPFGAGQAQQFCIQIERRVPLSQRIFLSPAFLSLSNRERDICLCLLRGRSQTEAAKELGIKPSSAIYYIRSLYQRLGIESRNDLQAALLNNEF